jgi:murein DD-endopeptidase MepM/ murein hydrolase activator NlpD
MANEFYTLIVVPHAKAKFRKIQVSVRLTKWAMGIAATMALILTGVLAHYTWINVEVGELRRLRSENVALSTKAQAYEQNAAKLQAKLMALQNMVMKLGVMAGLEKTLPDPAIGGVGGLTRLETTSPSAEARLSMGVMEKTTEELTARSSRLEEFYQGQKVVLAATPSIWPVRGYLSSTFGNRVDPFTGQPDFHPGIDIATPIGTKVQAPADGVVVSTGVKGSYGNAIIIDHGYGVMTRYGHLSGFNVRPGQRVRRGDVIGFVGQTGRATAPHLHYEVWVKEQNQNPIQYILDEDRSFG